ncbi:uncharacterized protein BKA55DRAFT_526476 [Fusarium redolens]|uniref:Ankyrin n=1 Tax=Fusarium redolens TaxID=48865 RepID=A0A9P9FZ23_FUSRE|nr:uncharacterized protein BKA55DRAFT_526476 [Fusarium redolens]KAH7230104.1 hypothetical protein BKA55DRAFT_526476 [Fusarium redolens]
MAFLNPASFGFPACSITYVHFGNISPKSYDPLRASLSQNYTEEFTCTAMLSPLCLAASKGLTEVVRFLERFDSTDKHRDLNLALFLANRSGHLETSALLLEKKANPLQAFSANGLHGAAWRGLYEHIRTYTRDGYVDPDILDGSSATPVIYAILGIQDEQGAWETINYLFNLGARPWRRFGIQQLSYSQIARRERRMFLARKLEEWETRLSPTILNSSRESSCMPGEDDDIQPDNEQPHEVLEAEGAPNAIGEARPTGGEDNSVPPDNEGPREDSGTDRGAGTSRNPSCPAGVGTDGHIDNKRPREDSEAARETKRARIA